MDRIHFPRQSATLLRFPVRSSPGTDAFTLADRMALNLWGRRATLVGYSRLVIEPGCPGAGPDRAAYALVYVKNDPWSRWGLSRGVDGITVWCSRTGADRGTFDAMDEALKSLERPSA